MTSESHAWRYLEMPGGYELMRGNHGRIRPSWKIRFRGELIGFAASEREGRALVKAHRVAWRNAIDADCAAIMAGTQGGLSNATN